MNTTAANGSPPERRSYSPTTSASPSGSSSEGGHGHPGRYGAGTYRRRPAGVDSLAQVPLREMANVPMRHLKTMVELNWARSPPRHSRSTASKPATSGTGNKWQAIIEPSTPGFRVSVTVNNTVSTTEVSADPPRWGVPGRLPLHGTIGIERQRTDAGNHRRGQLGRRSWVRPRA